MSTHVLSPDTQAILLLCASFGQNRQAEPQPLTVKEYGYLVRWLLEQNLTPASLLENSLLESSLPEEREKGQLQDISVGQLNPERLAALLERGAMLGLAVENWTNKGIWVLARSDRHYPRRLKKQLQHAAPPILYGVGNIDLLSKGGLAVLGSRDVDEEAIAYTDRVAQTCAEEGIQVVSGGARGVDRSALLAAVQAGGTALAILADSLTKAAVYGKYRSGIREGQLTLVSAYDPDAGFTVGNAMGRNKYVYALADYVLVVSSSLGKGGTWAGATEALQRIKDVPVFVRMQGNLPPGNRALLDKGAKPFPNLSENGSLAELLQAASAEEASLPLIPEGLPDKEVREIQVQDNDIQDNDIQKRDPGVASPIAELLEAATESEPQAAKASQANPEAIAPEASIYEVVLPLILRKLEQPQAIKALAKSLDVRESQLQDWLKRAVDEGNISKTKRPVRYVANPLTRRL